MMNKSNSIEAIDKANLTNQAKIRLDEISKIEIILSKRLIKENRAVKNWASILLFLIILTKLQLFSVEQVVEY